MNKEKLSFEQRQVIVSIQNSIPKEWIDRVTKREDIAPTIKEVMELALKDPDVSQETKKEAEMVLNSALLNQQIDVEQSEVAQLIDAYVEKEIIKAVFLGKLPPIKKKRSFEQANKRFNKLKEKYEKK